MNRSSNLRLTGFAGPEGNYCERGVRQARQGQSRSQETYSEILLDETTETSLVLEVSLAPEDRKYVTEEMERGEGTHKNTEEQLIMSLLRSTLEVLVLEKRKATDAGVNLTC